MLFISTKNDIRTSLLEKQARKFQIRTCLWCHSLLKYSKELHRIMTWKICQDCKKGVCKNCTQTVSAEFRITKCIKHSYGLMCVGRMEERIMSHRWPMTEVKSRKLCCSEGVKGQGTYVPTSRRASPGPCLRKAAWVTTSTGKYICMWLLVNCENQKDNSLVNLHPKCSIQCLGLFFFSVVASVL